MSTASPPGRATTTPPLVEGQRLDQPTFHERCEAMPQGTRAELINGVVFMPSPLGHGHGRAHTPATVWLMYYEEKTLGVEVLDNATTILGDRSELQPDLLLRVLPECGGRTRTERFIRGAPELVVEVAHTTRYADLGPKLDDYERAGVLEYVVRALGPDEVIWHTMQQDGRLVAVPHDGDGLYRSRAFPGLWLDPQALLNRDTRRVREVIDLGTSTAEHAAFVARLAAARDAP